MKSQAAGVVCAVLLSVVSVDNSAQVHAPGGARKFVVRPVRAARADRSRPFSAESHDT